MTSALLAGGGKLFQVGLMYDDGGKGGGKGGGKDPNVLGGP
jgi:hypothetical protein